MLILSHPSMFLFKWFYFVFPILTAISLCVQFTNWVIRYVPVVIIFSVSEKIQINVFVVQFASYLILVFKKIILIYKYLSMHHTTLFNNRYHRYTIWTVILFEMKSPPEEFPGCGNLVIIVNSYMTWLLSYILYEEKKPIWL